MHAALAAGDDPTEAIERLRDENLRQQAEREDLLAKNGYPRDYLTYKPSCELCWDTGYQGAAPCVCVRKRYSKKLIDDLSTILPIHDQNFSSFNLDYYPNRPDSRLGASPRDIMQNNYEDCLCYAQTFGLHKDNLLLYGSTGLGKTFLSTSIAKHISENGFSVAYDTAIQVFGSYESVKFNSADAHEASNRIHKYENADLLIIDDLGTEMQTNFSISAFYNLLSMRLMKGRPMIINTNLMPLELEKRYSAAISSRLRGEFKHLRFIGEDIRLLRKK
jgi:DNA replication protein DnaC